MKNDLTNYERNLNNPSHAAAGFCGVKFVKTPEECEALPLPGILYLTGDPSIYRTLLDKKLPVVPVLTQDNRSASFPGAVYLIEQPEEVDDDSYEKIYQRLTGQPWTILTTKRCIVRELAVSDLDALYELYDMDALRYVEGPSPYRKVEKEILSSYIDKVYGFYGFGTWGVYLRQTEQQEGQSDPKPEGRAGKLIGRIGYEPYLAGAEGVRFGYLLHQDYRGQGYAAEVCRALLTYGREELCFERIEAVVSPDNTASIRLLERLGFTLQPNTVFLSSKEEAEDSPPLLYVLS